MSLSPLQPLHKRPVATLQAASVEAQPKPSNARPVNPNAVRFSSGGWLGAFLRSPAATYVATAEANQSVAKFTQDTLSVWCPKIIIARSWAERTELTFLEFIESALFYFAPAVFGQYLFKEAMKQVSPLAKKPGLAKYLASPLKAIPKGSQKALLPVKAGILLASGGVIAAEYSLSFVKNLLTENLFNKSDFSSVVALSNKSMKEGEVTPAHQKAHRRIKQSVGLAATLIGSGLALAAFGHRAKWLEKPLEKFVRNFDFSFNGVTKTLKNGKKVQDAVFGLSRTQMRMTILAGVLGYLDASRDHLETLEILSRVAAVVAPYLAFGADAISGAMAKHWYKPLINHQHQVDHTIEERFLHKVFGKNFIGNQWLTASQQIKSFQDLEPLKATSPELYNSLRNMKLKHFFLSLGIGVVGVGIVVTKLNQLWTKERFRQGKEQEQLRYQLDKLVNSGKDGTAPNDDPATKRVARFDESAYNPDKWVYVPPPPVAYLPRPYLWSSVPAQQLQLGTQPLPGRPQLPAL